MLRAAGSGTPRFGIVVPGTTTWGFWMKLIRSSGVLGTLPRIVVFVALPASGGVLAGWISAHRAAALKAARVLRDS